MQTYVDQAPIAIEFFSQHGVEFQLTPGLADHYYPVAPGSTMTGRSIEPVPVSTRVLGKWADKIRDAFIDSRNLTVEEFTSWGGIVNYNNWDHARINERVKNLVKANGPALIIHFVKCLLARSVPIFLDTPAECLLYEDGHVSGVRVRGGRHVRAHKGVILGNGRMGGRCRPGARIRRCAGSVLALSPRRKR